MRYMAQIILAYSAGVLMALGKSWETTVIAMAVMFILPWWHKED